MTIKTILIALLIGSLGPFTVGSAAAPGTGSQRRAVIIPMKEDINPISGELLKRRFQQAIDRGTDVIILDIESPGGWTAVTFELMDMVAAADTVETVALIEKDAISGAALLSLACDRILMRPDARIGDAGEIVMGPDGAFRYTEAKSRSVLAQKVRDAAAATGRPAVLAEKMTDRSMVVYNATHRETGEQKLLSDRDLESMPGADDWDRGAVIREANKDAFLTLNGSRAVELGLADGLIDSRDDALRILNVQQPVPVLERTWVDTWVFLFNTTAGTFLLIFLGLAALAVELSAPGLGIGGLTSLLCFGLFFWARFLGGTSGWLEVILFVTGLAFIAAEVFVIPGFGVAGLSGLALTVGSLVMASRRVTWPVGGGENWGDLGVDVLTVLGAFVGFAVVIIGLSALLGQFPGLSRLTLTPPAAEGVDAALAEPMVAAGLPTIGQSGTTTSPLRPGGRARFQDGGPIDVSTEGDYVDSGCPIRVVAVQGHRVTVRPV